MDDPTATQIVTTLVDILEPILKKLRDDSKVKLLSSLFGGTKDTDRFETYFEYYHREIRRLRIGVAPIINQLSLKTHGDVLRICREVSNTIVNPKDEIIAGLRAHFPDADIEAINTSLDTAVRLWLMINIRDEDISVRVPQTPPVPWERSKSLAALITETFRPSTVDVGFQAGRLDPSFTAANMVRMCGLRIRWTDSLEDHLRLDRRNLGKDLAVFPHKEFLVGQLQAKRR
jgi:hypothetical protein